MNRHGADDTTEKMAALKNSLQWVWLVLEGVELSSWALLPSTLYC